MGQAHAGILRDVRTMVESCGGKFWLLHQGGGPIRKNGRAPLMGSAGIPDSIIMFLALPWGKPIHVYFDAKTGRDKPSEAQLMFQAYAKANDTDVLFGDAEVVASYLRMCGVDVKLF